MFRKKFNNKIFLVGKFLPYLEPDLPYKPAENYLITTKENENDLTLLNDNRTHLLCKL